MRGALLTAAGAAGTYCPKDTRHFMNFINLTNFMNPIKYYEKEMDY